MLPPPLRRLPRTRAPGAQGVGGLELVLATLAVLLRRSELEGRPVRWFWTLDLNHSALDWRFMLTLSGISKAYGERVLFADATLQVNRQDRIGLVGPNGAGKTTGWRRRARSDAPHLGARACIETSLSPC